MLGGLFQSNEKKVHLSIVLQPHCQRQFFEGGDVIEGEIYLDVVNDHFKADCLKLLFCGGERTCTHWTTHSNKHKNHHRKYQRRDFVNIPMDLAYFDKNEDACTEKNFPISICLQIHYPIDR